MPIDPTNGGFPGLDDFPGLEEMFENNEYLQVIWQLMEKQTEAANKNMVLEQMSYKISKAAESAYKTAGDFVLRSLEAGYREKEAMMGAELDSIMMPQFDHKPAHAVREDAPSVSDGYEGDPLYKYHYHAEKLGVILAKLDSGEPLSEADKAYLEDLHLDPTDVDSIRAKYEFYKDLAEAVDKHTGPGADVEGFLEALWDRVESHKELVPLYEDAIEKEQKYRQIEHIYQILSQDNNALKNPKTFLSDAQINFLEENGIDIDDYDPSNSGRLSKSEREDFLKDVKAKRDDLKDEYDAAVETLLDALEELEDGPVLPPNDDPDGQSAQSAGAMGASSLGLDQADSEEEQEEAERLLNQLGI